METPSIRNTPYTPPIRPKKVDERRQDRQEQRFADTLRREAEEQGGDGTALEREPEAPIERRLQDRRRDVRREHPDGEHHLDVMA